MAKADVLARVKSDLALGHTHTAIQRLRTLLTAEPEDLEIHQLLAEVYRQTGNLVEAGRWAFLTDDLRANELAAFERANPDPWLRLRLIRWSADPELLPDDGARLRLIDLRAAADAADPARRWTLADTAPARSNTVPCLFVAVTLVLFGGLVVIGVLRAIGFFTP